MNNAQKYMENLCNATYVILFLATRQNSLKLHYTLKRKGNDTAKEHR